MYLIALKMMLGDRVKYFMLITALSFATLLMTQQVSIFWGVMRSTTVTLRNTDAPIWVVDPFVERINDIQPIIDTDLYKVRSIPGVKWAVPFYYSVLKEKLYNGHFKNVQLTGLDPSTLIGLPGFMLKGKAEDLWKSDGVIVDEIGLKKIGDSLNKPLDLGDTFDINDHEVRIVGIVKTEESFFGDPFVFTTYTRALEIAPPTRKTLTSILVYPKENVKTWDLAKKIEEQTGLRAFTENEFFWSTLWWIFQNTGIPVSFGTTVILGFVIGMAVSAQTFYSFINENIKNIGALKAMGASNLVLKNMLLFQTIIAGFFGFGIGLGISTIFGLLIKLTGRLPFYSTWQIPLFTFFIIMLISLFSAYLGIRKVNKYEVAEVFRG